MASDTTMRFRLVIADDHRLVAECLAEQLAAKHEVVGIVHALDNVIPAIEKTTPDAVLLDLSFGLKSALPLIPIIVESFPRTSVIVVSMHAEPALAEAALAAGARHYVVKTQGTADVLDAVASIADCSPKGDDLAVTGPREPSKRARMVRRQVGALALSERQYNVLSRLAMGATRRAVAAEMGISAKGVDYNVNEVKRSLGLRRLVSVITWFREAIAAGRGSSG